MTTDTNLQLGTVTVLWDLQSLQEMWAGNVGTVYQLKGVCISWLTVGNPCGLPIPFFVCPKKRNQRKGSHATETAPTVKARNRRGKNSLRSNSLPLHPVPDFAARLSANGAN